MRRGNPWKLLVIAISTTCAWGCSSPSEGGGSGGATSTTPGSGGAVVGGSGGGPTGSGGTSTTPGSGGKPGSGGTPGLGGTRATGGTPGIGGSGKGGAITGAGGKAGAIVGTGGSGRGGGGGRNTTPRSGGAVGPGTGGSGTGGSTLDGGPPSGDDCVIGAFPAADPTAAGPFKVTIENPVGPTAGAALDGGAPPQFTMFRPTDMKQGGLCHPVITWGNGTGSTPTMYKVLLNNFASHGFVVIGSNSTNVAQGNPKPMIVGIDWVLQQNEDPASVLYHRIDTTHVGATGHSQGAMATSQASGDARIVSNVPIEGASAQRNLHGPAMFFCGGGDTVVGCDGAKSALAAVTTLPAMYAEYISVDHGSWMTFGGSKPSVVEATVTAWFRVHLMGDDSLRSWFYGADCKLCTDSGWIIDRKNMD